MNEIDRIRKQIAETHAGEQGWRRVLTTAEGSFSRTLAQKNLSRLAALRKTLLNQLKTPPMIIQLISTFLICLTPTLIVKPCSKQLASILLMT